MRHCRCTPRYRFGIFVKSHRRLADRYAGSRTRYQRRLDSHSRTRLFYGSLAKTTTFDPPLDIPYKSTVFPYSPFLSLHPRNDTHIDDNQVSDTLHRDFSSTFNDFVRPTRYSGSTSSFSVPFSSPVSNHQPQTINRKPPVAPSCSLPSLRWLLPSLLCSLQLRPRHSSSWVKRSS